MAQVFVRPIRPHFDAEYADLSGVPMNDDVDPILITEPPFFFIKGIADLVAKKTPSRFVSIVSFQSWKLISSSFADGPEIPALFINALMLHAFFSISLKNFFICCSSETSTLWQSILGLFLENLFYIYLL